MALKAQKMIIFSFIVCPECFLTNILCLVQLNDVGKFKVPSNDGHLEGRDCEGWRKRVKGGWKGSKRPRNVGRLRKAFDRCCKKFRSPPLVVRRP